MIVTYEEAMAVVARGGIVSRGGVVLYMGVDFARGTAGALVTATGVYGEMVYIPTDDDISADDWAEYIMED